MAVLHVCSKFLDGFFISFFLSALAILPTYLPTYLPIYTPTHLCYVCHWFWGGKYRYRDLFFLSGGER
ncbi:hypothetical protein BO86DRAFT_90208 [Aspergillus japonicus CBS 114.51]|uniref:Uncharacterized protein n=1 Tax=Aspergillus japonicus CBS 114.51 TaxID=1448312 RepID=A0A8T8X1D5_ASPJA|nr:hypothetical protein BO86DRAFT_90208 [Aspergillus japonicus CBS 114.51]RAH81875.1 hypothetical protein BO86DRAFT_90208 [Aspergillus japonicus CBS 114.51]